MASTARMIGHLCQQVQKQSLVESAGATEPT
jgi:hypothetical protein